MLMLEHNIFKVCLETYWNNMQAAIGSKKIWLLSFSLYLIHCAEETPNRSGRICLKGTSLGVRNFIAFTFIGIENFVKQLT